MNCVANEREWTESIKLPHRSLSGSLRQADQLTIVPCSSLAAESKQNYFHLF